MYWFSGLVALVEDIDLTVIKVEPSCISTEREGEHEPGDAFSRSVKRCHVKYRQSPCVQTVKTLYEPFLYSEKRQLTWTSHFRLDRSGLFGAGHWCAIRSFVAE